MPRLCLQMNCYTLGRAASSPKISVVTFAPLSRQSGSWRLFCATPGTKIDPCKVLMQQYMHPLVQQEEQLCKQMQQLERKKSSIEASIADCVKRIAAAREQEDCQKVKEDEHQKHALQLQKRRDELIIERDAKGNEYARKVEEVGFDEAEKRLEQIRLRQALKEIKGPLLQKYAELHSDVLTHNDKIKVAHAAAVKATQIASDLRSNAKTVQAKEESFKSDLNDVQRDLADLHTAIEDVRQKKGQAEFQASRLRKASAWAQRISPFIVPSVENLPILVLQRHQAIRVAATNLGMTSSRELLDLECVAAELKDFPGIELELRASGYLAVDLAQMEFSLLQLKAAGFSALEMLQIGIGIAELKEAGFEASELKEAGVEAKELHGIGFTADKLKAAGFKASALIDAGFTAAQLKLTGYDAQTLRQANLSAADLKEGGFLVSELLRASFTPKELKEAGIQAEQLREEGLKPVELMEAGFTEEELLDAGFPHDQARAAKFKSLGTSAKELLASNTFTVSQLKDAGWGTGELGKGWVQAAFS